MTYVDLKLETMISDGAQPSSPNQQDSFVDKEKAAEADHWLCTFETDGESGKKRLRDLSLDQYKPILERLRVNSNAWLEAVNGFGGDFKV